MTKRHILYTADGKREVHETTPVPMPTQAIALKLADEVSTATWIYDQITLKELEARRAPLVYTWLLLIVDDVTTFETTADRCSVLKWHSGEWREIAELTDPRVIRAVYDCESLQSFGEGAYTISHEEYANATVDDPLYELKKIALGLGEGNERA